MSKKKRDKKGFSSTADNPESWLLQALGGSGTATGVRVNQKNALQVAAFYACVNVLSQDLAKLPLRIYRKRVDGGRDVATDHPLHPLLASQPNRWQTRYEWKEQCQASLVMRGMTYIVKLFDGRGELSSLVPIHPDRVVILEAPDGDLLYQITRSGAHQSAQLDGLPLVVPSENMMPLRGLSLDGIHGLSVLSYARETLGLALATEQHGAKLFGNAARPGGVLEVPSVLGDQAYERLKSSWNDAHSGLTNAWKTAILEEGTKWQALSMSSEDSQFLQTRQYQVLDIARFFRVPPHKLQDLSRSTYSNIEHQSLEYVTDTLMPWLERWEAALERHLLTPVEREFYEIEFDVSRLLRGDIKSRYDAYARGRNWGWLNVNEIRRMEGLNPVDGGNTYLQPLNMIPAGASSQEALSNAQALAHVLFPGEATDA